MRKSIFKTSKTCEILLSKESEFHYLYQIFGGVSLSLTTNDLCFTNFSKKRIRVSKEEKNENDRSNDDDDKRIGVFEYVDGDVEQCAEWVQVGRESELRNDRARFRGETAES